MAPCRAAPTPHRCFPRIWGCGWRPPPRWISASTAAFTRRGCSCAQGSWTRPGTCPGAWSWSGDEGPWSDALLALRWEARIEATAGIQIVTAADSRYTLALLPWLNVYQGSLHERECDSCSLQLLDVKNTFGLSLALAGAWQLE